MKSKASFLENQSFHIRSGADVDVEFFKDGGFSKSF